MNFVNTEYLPHIIIAIICFWIFLFTLNRKYTNWVKSYWFLERSWMSWIASLFNFLGLSLMLISLLDLRGPEEKIKSNLPDQRTIIIIDSSASMLAEDVRPSRFVKALQMARHFVKNAAGHQVSIVLFSDIQKRLVPFTDDLDLLDSRLSALEKTNAVSGGSNISQAISEAVQYFETEDDKKSSMGNILVFTDAEETEGGMDVDLGNSVNLAVVGIGTAKGSNIPLRWDDGSFRGYKTFKGEQVITKLDESFIRSMGKNVKNYKYWIANSYSLPTDEVLSFFRSSFAKTVGKGDVKIRPVYSHLILIPAIILYCIGVILNRFKSFSVVALLIFVFFGNSEKTFAQEEKQKKLSPEVVKDLEKIKKGKAQRKEILKTAEKLLREEDLDRANELYKEYARPADEKEVSFNQATALLKSGNIDQAMPLIQSLMASEQKEELKDKMRNNLLLALNNQDKQKQKQKDKDQKQDNQDKKDGDQKDKGESGKNSDQSKDGKGDEEKKDKKDGKSGNKDHQQKNKDDQDKDQEEKDKNKKDPKDLDKPDRESKPQSLEEKEKMIEQKRKMIKTPAMIKQIMSDDRELQKKMMDTSTKESDSPKSKRDW